jgi:hypothetical protein
METFACAGCGLTLGFVSEVPSREDPDQQVATFVTRAAGAAPANGCPICKAYDWRLVP